VILSGCRGITPELFGDQLPWATGLVIVAHDVFDEIQVAEAASSTWVPSLNVAVVIIWRVCPAPAAT
jgi:hypothetical protein